MKKGLFVLTASLLALLIPACSPASQTGPGVETIVASTFQALTAAAPLATATSTPSNGTVVSFQNVGFIIPNELALGANAELVPLENEESAAPWQVAPEHIRFEFYGYNNQLAKASAMHIKIYPAQDYVDMNVGASINLPRLQAILAAPDAPMDIKNLPAVPYFNAAPLFTAQVKLLDFTGGSGVRMMTEYSQAVGPVSNIATVYHFQGLTSDGRYYIVAVLPLGASILIDGSDPLAVPPPGGVQFPGYTTLNPKDYGAYFRAVTDALNSADPSVFSPSLAMLDSLMESITVSTP